MHLISEKHCPEKVKNDMRMNMPKTTKMTDDATKQQNERLFYLFIYFNYLTLSYIVPI